MTKKTYAARASLDQRIAAAVDAAVERAVTAERRRNIDILGKIVSELRAMFDDKLARTIDEIAGVRNELRLMNQDKSQVTGIIRKEYFTLQPH
jgi:hypothetical protein